MAPAAATCITQTGHHIVIPTFSHGQGLGDSSKENKPETELPYGLERKTDRGKRRGGEEGREEKRVEEERERMQTPVMTI